MTRPKIGCLPGVVAALILWVLIIAAGSCAVRAHDELKASDWIGDHNYRTANGSVSCCGKSDCGVIDKNAVRYTPRGLEINGDVTMFTAVDPNQWQHYHVNEIVPYAEVQPSEDMHFWRCAWPTQQQRKCFFGPPPGS